MMLVVGGLGFVSYKQNGLPFREIQSKNQAYANTIKSAFDADWVKECFDVPFAYQKKGDWFCSFGEKTVTPSIFVYGDSHAMALLPSIKQLAIDSRTHILFAGNSGCLPLLGTQVNRGAEWLKTYNCPKLNDRIFEYVKSNKIKSVFLISRWTYYSKVNVGPGDGVSLSAKQLDAAEKDSEGGVWYEYGIQQTIEKYRSIGVRVYLFDDNPMQPQEPIDVLKKSSLTDESINRFSVTVEEHKKHQSWISSQFKKIGSDAASIVNFDDVLCRNNICPYVDKGRFLYSDDDHLSVDGAKFVYPSLLKLLSTVSSDFKRKASL